MWGWGVPVNGARRGRRPRCPALRATKPCHCETSPQTGCGNLCTIFLRGAYRDCHTSDIGHWFAMTTFFAFTALGRQSRRPLQRAICVYRRGDVGSEMSAASGGRSESSEWQRSKFQASAARQRRNFGHRNRTSPPTKFVIPAAFNGGRGRTPPLRTGARTLCVHCFGASGTPPPTTHHCRPVIYHPNIKDQLL